MWVFAWCGRVGEGGGRVSLPFALTPSSPLPGTFLCPVGSHLCGSSDNSVLGSSEVVWQSIDGRRHAHGEVTDPWTSHRYVLV